MKYPFILERNLQWAFIYAWSCWTMSFCEFYQSEKKLTSFVKMLDVFGNHAKPMCKAFSEKKRSSHFSKHRKVITPLRGFWREKKEELLFLKKSTESIYTTIHKTFFFVWRGKARTKRADLRRVQTYFQTLLLKFKLFQICISH